MSTDPDLLGEPEQQTGSQGQSGDPAVLAKAVAEATARAEQAESDNAKLRAKNREQQAHALGTEHKLDPATVELLKGVPIDEMPAKAKAIADARAGGQPAPTPPPPTEQKPPDGQPAPPPADAQPKDASALQAMQSGGDTVGDDPAARAAAQQDMNTRIAQAKDLNEVRAIQDEYRAKMREARS